MTEPQKQQEQISHQVDSIKYNTERLLSQYVAMKNENEILKNQVQALRNSIQEKKNDLAELQQQFTLLKTAKSISEVSGTTGKGDIKQKINEFIREIDKTIDLLNT